MAPGIYGSKLHSRVTAVTALVKLAASVDYSSQAYTSVLQYIPDSKVHGANMGPIWGWQDPSGTHFGPMNFAIWDTS